MCGNWVKHVDLVNTFHTCSECGERALEKLVWFDTTEEVLSKFCPNCGALMTAESDVK